MEPQNPLDDLRSQPFTMYGEGTQAKLVWDTFRGNLSISHAEGQSMKGAERRQLSDDVITLIKMGIKKMGESSSDATYPIVVSKWDRDQKKFVHDYVISIVKDASRKYFFDVDFGKGKTRFSLGKMSGIVLGSDPIPEAEQSSIRMRSFHDWLCEVVPLSRILGRRKIQMNNGGGNGGNRGGGNGQYRSAPPANNGGGDGDWSSNQF